MRRFLLAVVLVTVGVGIGDTPRAQQKPVQPAQVAAPAPTPAPAVPVFDELDTAWRQTVLVAQQSASTACQALDSVKQFNAILADLTAKYETRHPGFSADWARGQAVVKPPPPK